MKTLTLSILMFLLTVCFYPAYGGIRYEIDIISVGDTSSEVIIKLGQCGKILTKEFISKETSIETNENKIGEKAKRKINRALANTC